LWADKSGGEITQQPIIHPVAWLLLAAFSQVHREYGEENSEWKGLKNLQFDQNISVRNI
jgi:hypothetical protein